MAEPWYRLPRVGDLVAPLRTPWGEVANATRGLVTRVAEDRSRAGGNRLMCLVAWSNGSETFTEERYLKIVEFVVDNEQWQGIIKAQERSTHESDNRNCG
jgi:hypothetical protein